MRITVNPGVPAGELPVEMNEGSGKPFGTIDFGSAYITVHADEDADRIIRAAVRLKAMRSMLAVPHAFVGGTRAAGYKSGACVQCGMLAKEAPHAEPASPEAVAVLAASIADGTPLLVTDLCQYHGGEGQSGSQCGACRDELVDHPDEADGFASAELGRGLA